MRSSLRPRSAPRLYILALSLSVIGACTTLTPLTVDTRATAPVIDGFGATTLLPSQANEPARRLFAQGMAQVYAFNPGEAIRAFKAALAQDPECGMCAWAIAQQMGPNINNPTRGDLKMAMQYVDYAVKHSKGVSPRDMALIESLALRYGHSAGSTLAPPGGGDICRTASSTTRPADPLDIAYAQQMRVLTSRFPADPDILSMYAEAEMVATRGDWWNPATGKPIGLIGELATMLEAGLARHPDHVGLNHYMIHAVDAVPVAARAIAAADRLGSLAPKSPHLLHMPSHTYAHLGRYADATRVNQLAVAADEAMMEQLKQQKFSITRDWRGHNSHFQWYGALMEGRGDLALETARAAAGRARSDHAYSEYVRSLPMLTLLHMQRWEQVLKEPMPTGGKGIAAVLGEMARGIAMARLGQSAEARATLARLEPQVKTLVARSGGKDYMDRMALAFATSARDQLGAEIAFAEQRVDEALKLQAQAVAATAVVDSSEPPMLASGPRLRLGSMQLRAKRFAQAEQVFRTDLALHPKSGWALQGLGKALAAQNKQAEAKNAERDMAASWVLADAQLRTQ